LNSNQKLIAAYCKDWIILAEDRDKWRELLNTVVNKVKVKVKLALEQATKAQRGSRGITPLFL